MARDSDELMHEENAPTGGNRRSPVLMIVVCIVVGILLWHLVGNWFGGDSKTTSSKHPSSDNTTTYNPRRAQEREYQDQQTSSAVDKTFSVDDRTDESAVVAVDRRVSQTNDRLKKLESSINKSKQSQDRQLQRLQNRIDQKLNEITQSIQDQSNSKVLDERDQAMSGNSQGASSARGMPRLGSQSADTSGGSQGDKTGDTANHQRQQSDDFPYRRLGTASPQSGSGGGLGLFGNSSGSSNGASARKVAAHGQQPPASPSAKNGSKNSQPPPLNQSPDSGGDSNQTAKSKYDKVTVPGNSWVHVTDMHGVACPVGGGQSGGKGSGSLLSQVPITLPVEGNFHGPNGTTYRLGSPNISGTCIGQETERPTAIIKVERLSYVGPDGTPQYIPINGYLIDRRDNQFGIAGFLDQAHGSEIAKAAAAAGLSAAGDIFSDSQFDTTFFGGTGGANTGAASSIQGKDVPAAVLGKSFSATANKIAEAYQKAADRVVPVVRIQAGLPITMITTTPFQYLKADSNSEVSNVQ